MTTAAHEIGHTVGMPHEHQNHSPESSTTTCRGPLQPFPRGLTSSSAEYADCCRWYRSNAC
ncbi:reprolysin-like metallopeptidase [Mycobacterium sp. URHB0021]